MIKSNKGKNYLINLFIVSSIFLLDRFSKIYVIYLNDKLLVSEIFSSKFLNINFIWNRGIAFGLFSFDELKLYNILTILILIIIILVVVLGGAGAFFFMGGGDDTAAPAQDENNTEVSDSTETNLEKAELVEEPKSEESTKNNEPEVSEEANDSTTVEADQTEEVDTTATE